jgi:hypothetical protein
VTAATAAAAAVDPGPVPDVRPEHHLRLYGDVRPGDRGPQLLLMMACSCGAMRSFEDGAAEPVLHNTAELHRKGGPLG